MRRLIWAWRPCPFNQGAAWCQGADKAVGAAHGGIRIEFQTSVRCTFPVQRTPTTSKTVLQRELKEACIGRIGSQ